MNNQSVECRYQKQYGNQNYRRGYLGSLWATPFFIAVLLFIFRNSRPIPQVEEVLEP